MAHCRTPSRVPAGATALLLTVCAVVVAVSAARGQEPVQSTMTRLYAPVEIGADIDALPASERAALAHILAAARVMDALFLEQVWAGNPSLLMALQDDGSPAGRARLEYFLLNKGPWSRLEDDRAFLPGVPPKPAGAAYYPPDASRDEVASWIDGLSGEAREAATGFFTTIRRGPGGALRAVPYSVEYQGPLAVAADHLRAAAARTAEPTLARYLRERAEAFASNDYYASDVAWMELNGAIEPTIGPYEVYEDGWFNYKAAFEAFVTIRDDAETDQLARFGAELQGLEDALPIDARYRDPELGALAPIRVVNVAFTAGDANSGVQTAAFNLPNDERVLREHGAKRVMLKNVQEAKFRHVLAPIAAVALPSAERADVSFDAFFTHILMHELMHGLGPHDVEVGGRATTVRQALREASSTIEEAKADIIGALGAPPPHRHGGDRPLSRPLDLHDVPHLDLPVDPLWNQRGAWARRGDSAQHVPRHRGGDGRRGRPLCGRPRPHPGSGRGTHPAPDDHPGAGRLRRSGPGARDARGGAARGAARARPPRRRPGGHPAALHDYRTVRSAMQSALFGTHRSHTRAHGAPG